LPTTFSRATSPKTLRNLAAVLLVVAGCAHGQQPGPFVFASQEQARAILGAHDDYVRATTALERPATLRSSEQMDAARFTAEMSATALAWTEEERRAFAPVRAQLSTFIAAMRWKGPSPILLVKATDRLMNGFPHTRANAIVLQESMLEQMFASAAVMSYFMAHETFHVLSRANPALREELYAALGFRACPALDMPAPLARLRLTNPDAPENRHTIAVRRAGRGIEVLPFVHFPTDAFDARAGFAGQMRTSWLPVERRGGRCSVRAEAERPALEELEGFGEQVGWNTGYVIHPEEILADNFAFLFRRPEKLASPEILERVRRILH
jgi:hypothetical protein